MGLTKCKFRVSVGRLRSESGAPISIFATTAYEPQHHFLPEHADNPPQKIQKAPILILIMQDDNELPTEVLNTILRFSTSDLTTSLRSYNCDGQSEWELYDRALQDCTQYRLVDSTWNAVVTPFLYSILVLAAWPLEKLLRRAKAVDYHPEMIKALVISGCADHHPVEEVERQIFDILCSRLRQCSSISLLDVHLGGYTPLLESESEEFFGNIQSDSLTSVAILYTTIDVISGAISGLGTRSSQLKELVLYSVYWDAAQLAPSVPFVFPSLNSLTMHWEWPPGLGRTPFAQLFSTLVLGEGNGSAAPLRDLTISGILDLDAPHISTLLSSYNIGITLTSIQLNLPPSLTTSTLFEALPTTILGLCPVLTRFLYFAWCPTSLLYGLPPRLKEFGVTIVHIAGPEAASLLTTIMPLIELVKEPRFRKGIQKLHIQWALFQPPGAERRLRDACVEEGVEFSSIEASTIAKPVWSSGL
ncbi:hypothetical protein BDN72DRAFT_854866 [Pluteus cervinus]|uniref:Uncharacterized protein n=1 Tax=Pluteus cervinus TaxID=181527 RepID=A0ACD3B6A3_9AGAR|nr:hypothetical protein BDN72DRAFT_854866 [Pluteus cervinus]